MEMWRHEKEPVAAILGCSVRGDLLCGHSNCIRSRSTPLMAEASVTLFLLLETTQHLNGTGLFSPSQHSNQTPAFPSLLAHRSYF